MSQTTSACGSLCPSKLPFQNSPKLVALLQDSVNSGASVGFLPPLPVEVAEEYWLETLNEVSRGKRVLLVSREGEAVTGAVQLALVTKQPSLHRAEVQAAPPKRPPII